MNRTVLDSSAVLAVLHQEPGAERALLYFPAGTISSVNVAEVLTKSVEKGHNIMTAIEIFNMLRLEVVDFDLDQAAKAAELRPLTKHIGLSFGDRACIALAIIRNMTAVTADRDWNKLTICPIEVIR